MSSSHQLMPAERSPAQAALDLIDQLANVTLHDNVLVLEVENLLDGWPTYEINFTPDKPGPLKLIIRLLDTVKLVKLEDCPDSEAEGLLPGKPKGRKSTCPQSETQGQRDLGDPDITMVDLATDSSGRVNAKPIQLLGLRVLKEPPVHKVPASSRRPFHDTDWPPRRPRKLRPISPDERITELHTFRTFSAAVGPLPQPKHTM
ncbi:hypothetical protein EV702DRAFT_1194834 [Suillus placidus]|uniref:Uncharacterized protein n=1 Tax=Suillus placidus TaxID=48579 RepID=A0A9P7A0C7_9AGAM|nr:hypothetical protein EV702DRAFT_1194834 [Suillus placidus]